MLEPICVRLNRSSNSNNLIEVNTIQSVRTYGHERLVCVTRSTSIMLSIHTITILIVDDLYRLKDTPPLTSGGFRPTTSSASGPDSLYSKI